MPELSTDDVEAFTNGRLDADSDETERLLAAALVAARRYCGWHVSPVKSGDVLTLDGPCGRVLDLPTRRLSAVTSVTENGSTIDVSKLEWSTNGSVRKASGAPWSCKYRSISATITHGFTEEEAGDWRQAILSMVDTMSKVNAGGSEPAGAPIRKKVDDVEYEWSDAAAAEAASRAVYSVSHVLDEFRCPAVLFA